MYKIPKQENVNLKQIKIKSDESVEFKATATFTDGEEIYVNDLNEKYVFPPHPDFVEALKKMKPYLAKFCGLTDVESMLRAKDFKATSSQLEQLENYLVHKNADIVVTGIALSGEDGNRGVIITGTYKGQAINSRKTKFTTDLGFDNELEAEVDAIEDEAYKYIFEGKKAKLEEFGADPNQQSIDGTGEEFEQDFKSKAAGE